MKRIYIAGCGGMLGEAFYQQFKNDYELMCTDIDINDIWLNYCDFRDFDEYRKQVMDFKSDYLFHLGAFTDLEYCELHADETYITNTTSVENAVYIAKELDIPLLYISTAGIFDGTRDTFDDWDEPNPMGVYGRSKWAGETFVEKNMDKYYICRAGWMMGSGPKKDKKFIQKIMKQLKDGNKVLNIVDDKDGTPTYTIDFANNVKELINTPFYGLYNMVCGGLTSRLEVAAELIKLLNLENEITINIVDSDFFKDEYFAARPPCERLINKKLDLRGLNKMRDWKVCLAEYLRDYYKGYL